MEKKTFTINQVAKVVGLARTTIIRYEECGIVHPSMIKSNGTRLYDNIEVSKILRIKELRNSGFGLSDIREFYDKNGDDLKLIKTYERLIANETMYLNELEMRRSDKKYVMIKGKTRDVYCIKRHYDHFKGFLSKGPELVAFYHDLIKEGIILTGEPPFAIDYRTKYLDRIYDEPFPYDICIPCRHDQKGAVLEKGYTAVFLLWYGEAFSLAEVWDKLVDHVKDNDIKVIDYPRLSTIITATLGEGIDPHNFLSMIALPIGEDD